MIGEVARPGKPNGRFITDRDSQAERLPVQGRCQARRKATPSLSDGRAETDVILTAPVRYGVTGRYVTFRVQVGDASETRAI